MKEGFKYCIYIKKKYILDVNHEEYVSLSVKENVVNQLLETDEEDDLQGNKNII